MSTGSAERGLPGAAGWLLALAVVAVWGSNFVVIHAALESLPPLLMAALRFGLVAWPLSWLVARPPLPRWRIASYGLAIGVGQFGLLYWAMNGHISPGLASLVVQTQVFFTIALAWVLGGERLRPLQWPALAVAAAGVVWIAWRAEGDASLTGLLMVLGAAAGWALGNHLARGTASAHVMGLVVHSAAWAAPVLLVLSLALEGPARIASGLAQAGLGAWTAVLWQALGNTVFGYGAWGWLLANYRASAIAPLALGVPVFGLATSAWWLGEALPGWKLGAAGLVMAGLALNTLAVRRPAALR